LFWSAISGVVSEDVGQGVG